MHSKTILLISSERTRLKIIYQALSQRGYEVISTEEQQAGLNILKDINYSVDIIVLEGPCQMKGNFFKELEINLQKLKKTVPFIIWEEGVARVEREENNSNNSYYLSGPFSLNKLLVKTDNLLEKQNNSNSKTISKFSPLSLYSEIISFSIKFVQIISLGFLR